jgi:hypothetical protein
MRRLWRAGARRRREGRRRSREAIALEEEPCVVGQGVGCQRVIQVRDQPSLLDYRSFQDGCSREMGPSYCPLWAVDSRIAFSPPARPTHPSYDEMEPFPPPLHPAVQIQGGAWTEIIYPLYLLEVRCRAGGPRATCPSLDLTEGGSKSAIRPFPRPQEAWATAPGLVTW